MKYEDKTTKEDEENRIIRIEVTAENWEDNKLLAKVWELKWMNLNM